MNNKNNKYQNKNALNGSSYAGQTQYTNRSGAKRQSSAAGTPDNSRYNYAGNRQDTERRNVGTTDNQNRNYPNGQNPYRDGGARSPNANSRMQNSRMPNSDMPYRQARNTQNPGVRTQNNRAANVKNGMQNVRASNVAAGNSRNRYENAQTAQNGNYRGSQYGQNPQNKNPQNKNSRNIRKNPPRPPKPKLTEEQILELGRLKQIERENMKKRIAAAIKRFFMRLAVLFAVYICFFAISVAFMAVDVFSHDGPDDEKIPQVLQIGEDGAKDTISVPVIIKSNPEGNIIYIKMSDIAEKYGFVLTGDKDRLRYVIDNGEEGTDSAGNSYNSVEFINGSATVYINTVRAELGGKVFFEGYDDAYVPSDFFSTYVNGITFTFDKENRKLVLYRNPIDPESTESGGDAADVVRYMPMEFLLKAPVTSASLNEEEVAKIQAIGTTAPDSGTYNSAGE